MFKKWNILVLLLAIALIPACSSTPKAPDQDEEKFDYITEEQAMEENKDIQENIDDDELVEEVKVPDRIFFGFDKFTLTPDAKDVLSKQAEWLTQDSETKIIIEGHCDERGTREYNLALGERRANAAKRFLVQKGIDAERISTISYGKDRPEFLGTSERVWGKNRRAVTVVVED